MEGPKLEFYVWNYDFNSNKYIRYNVFNNIQVYEWTVQSIKRYIRSPKNYKSYDWHIKDYIYGYKALCNDINMHIKNQEWCRCEYELCLANFWTDHQMRIDCYSQVEGNIECIVDYCIKAYKTWKKSV